MTLHASDLKTTTLHIALQFEHSPALPPFFGSKLEGAFGRALKAISCVLPEREVCAGCPYFSGCAYGESYHPQKPAHIAAKSLSDPPRPLLFRGQNPKPHSLEFTLVLLGEHQPMFRQYFSALLRMQNEGLGMRHAPFTLQGIWHIQPWTQHRTLLWNAENPNIPTLCADPAPPALPHPERMTLVLYSPLHISHHKKMLGIFDPEIFVRHLQRRLSNLEQMYGTAKTRGEDFDALPEYAKSIRVVKQNLTTANQKRAREMNMYGLTGTVELEGNLNPLGELLRLGEVLGVGKWTHFGMGGYRIIASRNNTALQDDPVFEPIQNFS